MPLWAGKIVGVREETPDPDLLAAEIEAVSNVPRSRGARALHSTVGIDIEVELHQLHGAVGGELAHNGEPGDEHPGGDQDSIVGPAGDQLR